MKKATSKEEKVAFIKDFLLDRFGMGALLGVSIIKLVYEIFLGMDHSLYKECARL